MTRLSRAAATGRPRATETRGPVRRLRGAINTEWPAENGPASSAATTGPPTQMNGGPVSADHGGINVDGPDGTRS